MKALSIKQPWAGLIVAGIKNIENRTWGTRYTGDLVICASKVPAPAHDWERARAKVKKMGLVFPEQLCAVNGCALGVVRFEHMVWAGDLGAESDHPAPQTVDFRWWSKDGYGWIFTDARALPHPVPVSGKLGLFNLPDEIVMSK